MTLDGAGTGLRGLPPGAQELVGSAPTLQARAVLDPARSATFESLIVIRRGLQPGRQSQPRLVRPRAGRGAAAERAGPGSTPAARRAADGRRHPARAGLAGTADSPAVTIDGKTGPVVLAGQRVRPGDACRRRQGSGRRARRVGAADDDARIAAAGARDRLPAGRPAAQTDRDPARRAGHAAWRRCRHRARRPARAWPARRRGPRPLRRWRAGSGRSSRATRSWTCAWPRRTGARTRPCASTRPALPAISARCSPRRWTQRSPMRSAAAPSTRACAPPISPRPRVTVDQATIGVGGRLAALDVTAAAKGSQGSQPFDLAAAAGLDVLGQRKTIRLTKLAGTLAGEPLRLAQPATVVLDRATVGVDTLDLALGPARVQGSLDLGDPRVRGQFEPGRAAAGGASEIRRPDARRHRPCQPRSHRLAAGTTAHPRRRGAEGCAGQSLERDHERYAQDHAPGGPGRERLGADRARCDTAHGARQPARQLRPGPAGVRPERRRQPWPAVSRGRSILRASPSLRPWMACSWPASCSWRSISAARWPSPASTARPCSPRVRSRSSRAGSTCEI